MPETDDAVELASDGPLTGLYTGAWSRLGPVLGFLVVVAVVGVGRSVTWMDPPLSDAHVYAYVGRAWLNGEIPYARVWEMKPPGIFAIDAAVFAIFPDSFHALAVVEGLCILGCAITVFLILRQSKVDRVACYLAVFVFVIAANSEWTSSNLTEIYLLLPVALSMLAFAKSLPDLQALWVFLAGLFAGLASTAKPTGLSPFLAQVAFLGLSSLLFHRYTFRRVATAALMMFAGVVTAWLPFATYFAWHGALAEMINVSFVYPLNYAASVPKSLSRYLQLMIYFLGNFYILAVFIALGFLAFVRDLITKDRRGEEGSHFNQRAFYLLCVLWLVVDLACALAGNRAHYQYVLPMSVSLGVVVGLTYSQQVGVLTGMQSRLLVSALLLSPVLVMYFNNQVRQFVHVVRYGHNLYHDAYAGHDQPSNAEEAAQVSAFIEGMRQADDTLFSWDINPAIFWRLHIKSPVAPLDLAFRNLFSGEVRQRFVGQVLAGLWSHPPTFIIDSSKPFERQDPLYTDFFNLIDRQYDCVKEFKLNYSHFRLYKRRSSA